MSSNGRLPASALAPIAGGGQLAKEAAAGWNALAAHVYSKTGQKISASEGYRTYARQQYFWNLYQSGQGNLAAYPGTSNHGLGLAVDLSSPAIRTLIDKYGAAYGWSKSWSDAQSEWWHILYQPGHYHGSDPGPDYSTVNKKKIKHKIDGIRKKVGDKLKRLNAIKRLVERFKKRINDLRKKLS